MADLRLKVLLEALDRASAPMRSAAGNIGRGLASIKASAEAASRSMEGVGRAGRAMADAGRSMAARVTLPVAALGGLTLRSAANFEEAMLNVQALTNATGSQFDRLRDQAKELGRTTQFSASQAADAMGFLAMAGFDVEKVYEAMPGVLQLAAASGMDLAEAADIASNILGGYALDAADLGRVNDILAKTMTSTNTNLSMLGESMKMVAPIAAGAGVEFSEAAAAIGIFGNNGIQGSMAGTALAAGLSRLLKPAAEAKDALTGLGIRKRDIIDSQGQLRSLADIIQLLQERGAGVTEMIQIFGQEAGPKMQTLLAAGHGELRRLTGALQESEGTAKRIADTRMQGLNGQLRALKSAVEGAMLAVADSGLLEWATGLAQRITVLVQRLAESNPALLKWGTIIAGVAAVMGPVLILLGTMAIGIKGLVVGAAAAKTALVLLAGGFAPVVAGIKAVAIALATTPIGLLVLALAGLAFVLIDNWSKVPGFFEGAFERIRTAFDEGFLQGIVAVLSEFNPVSLMATAIDGLVAYLFGIDLAAAGRAIVESILAGMREAWTVLAGWLAGVAADLLEKMNFGVDLSGIGLGKIDTGLGDTIAQLRQLQSGTTRAAGQGAAPIGAAGDRAAAAETRVGGTVKVSFDNAPQGMRVQSVRRESAAVGLDVETGYAMAP
ncbi:MAG: phage tail tape measure protein [Tistlia sp.]|uniref:phage tail tape measure protein n=1 Tax=Tistlia sp. TaxID=3057121 RepID=UPI0034A46BF4